MTHPNDPAPGVETEVIGTEPLYHLALAEELSANSAERVERIRSGPDRTGGP